jgi:hypothetical protein
MWGIGRGLTGGGESRRPVERRKEEAAGGRRARVFGRKEERRLNGVTEEGERPRGGFPSAVMLAQPAADGVAPLCGQVNG